MTPKEVDKICKEALKVWGVVPQIDKTQEECAELIQALNKWKYKPNYPKDRIVEEIADVLIMLEQMKYVFGFKEIEKFIDIKLKKVKNKLDEKKTSEAGFLSRIFKRNS